MALRESCKTKIQVPTQDGKGEIVDNYDEGKLYWVIFDYILMAWEGLPPGDATETKETLFNSPSASRFISNMANQLLVEEEEAFQDELKNFARSQNG